MNTVKIRDFEIGAGNPLALFAGPCVLEGLERSLYIGREIKAIANRLGIPYVFKASFDKANRSSFNSFRGPGLEKVYDTFVDYYKDEKQVTVVKAEEPRIYANEMAGSNAVKIFVYGNDERTLINVCFDNLGKGASGAAIQNMNIVLGIDEATGLVI